MSIAIIGGTGFLGTAVARRLLAHGLEPLVVARGRHPVALPEGARFEAADRMDGEKLAALFKAHGVSAVIDIFALTLKNTRPVLEATAAARARYVLVSSTDVYSNYGGLLGKETPPVRPEPATEDSPLRAIRHPYRGNARRPQGVEDAELFEDYDKLPIEDAARADARLGAVIMRLPMIFGPGDKQHRFGWVIRNAAAGTPLRLDRRAAGWLNSYAYVEDVAEALVLAATLPQAAGRTYNVAQPFVRTQAEWAATIVAAMGLDCEIIEVGPAEGGLLADRAEAMRLEYPLTLDGARIRRELGDTETVTEAEALSATIAWERAQG